MDNSLVHVINGTYDSSWVILSVLIAIIASYTALEFSSYISKTLSTTYKFWLACGAITMGIGIWSMHFIGMLAFQLPLQVTYDTTITLLSLAVAIIVSAFALFVISHHNMTLSRLLSGGTLMGLGIASMHYSGMAAMRMVNFSMTYSIGIVLFSVFFAIVISMIALWLASKLRDKKGKLVLLYKIISANIMGFAIAGMHYIGMYATVFTTSVHTDLISTSSISDNNWLVGTIAIVSVLLVFLSLVAIRVDQFISTQAEALSLSRQRYKQITDNAADTIITIDDHGIIESFNRAGEELFGYSVDEIVGKKYFLTRCSP